MKDNDGWVMCDGLSDIGVSDYVSDKECLMFGWFVCVIFFFYVLCNVTCVGVVWCDWFFVELGFCRLKY